MTSKAERHILIFDSGRMEHLIQSLSKEDGSEAPYNAAEICDTLVSTHDKGFAEPESVAEMQYLQWLFLNTIQGMVKLPTTESAELSARLAPLSQTHLLNMPGEVLLEFFMDLPVPQLVRLRSVGRYFRATIDESYTLQTRIAHHFLTVMQHKANIPLDDIRYSLEENSLALEIQNDLSVHHLAKDLTRAIPWISNLIIKNCRAPQLQEILTELQHSNRLTTLYLCDCQLDPHCLSLLQNLQKNGSQQRRVPILYLCNANTTDGKELPDELTTVPDRVKILTRAEAHKYSIERFQGEEADLNCLSEFERQVSNYSVRPNNVLEIYDSMRATLKSRIISSIWHSVLMDPSIDPVPTNRISFKVRSYIQADPHHPSLIAAARSFRDEFQQQTLIMKDDLLVKRA